MIFLPYPAVSMTASRDCSIRIAIECSLAYTYGHAEWDIEVFVSEGRVTLSGRASSVPAATRAAEIAADFTSKPVLNTIEIASDLPAARP